MVMVTEIKERNNIYKGLTLTALYINNSFNPQPCAHGISIIRSLQMKAQRSQITCTGSHRQRRASNPDDPAPGSMFLATLPLKELSVGSKSEMTP